MWSHPFRFLAALSTALRLSACGGDDKDDDSGDKPTRSPLRAEAGQYRGAPRFSPDGSRIAFLRTQGGNDTHELAVMNADGTHVRVLANNGTSLASADWSSDCSRIYDSGDDGIYRLPATGGTPTLEYGDFAASALDLSPDDRRIVHATNGSPARPR